MDNEENDTRYQTMRDLLTEARKDAGHTQTGLAWELGKSQSYVSKYERGERRLDLIEVIDIARVLGVSSYGLVRNLAKLKPDGTLRKKSE